MPASKSSRGRRKYSEEERQAARAAERARVESSVRALLTSEGWRRWAETRATFHDYSMGNCLLIASQRPDATRVAGFRAWQQLGRQVRRGERSIKIMAPMSVKRVDEETGEERRVPFFRAVPVFDLAQTDGEPLAEAPCEPITGDSHARFLQPLREYAASMGIATIIGPIDGEAHGYYSESGRRIVIADRLAPNGMVRTLVHELAHAHGVTYRDYSRGEAEVIVETAGTIVCGALGLDTSGEAIPYIAGWGESGDLEAIKRHAETVDTIARKIEAACGIGGAR